MNFSPLGRSLVLVLVLGSVLQFPHPSSSVGPRFFSKNALKTSIISWNSYCHCTYVIASRDSSQNGQLLVGYWGQNSAGPSVGPDNYEKPLKDVCSTTKYDILVASFVVTFWDSKNKDELPGLNFANHCWTSVSPEYPSLLRCPKIEEGIKECQKRGKKVSMSIGGATGDGTLPNPAKAKELANTLYGLFLGGKKYQGLRPFGSAVMDGIDMDIEHGSYKYYPEFITELHRLMDADSSKSYLITGAPQCPFPDKYLGPVKPGTGLEEAGQYVDHLYVQFYNNYCYTGAGKDFDDSLNQWLQFSQSNSPKGPLIFIGVPAATKASSNPKYYRSPSQLKALYEKIRDKPGIGGIMMWDVSWDQNNVIDGRRYSDHVADILQESPIKPPTTQTPGGTTQAPSTATSPITTQAPGKKTPTTQTSGGTTQAPSTATPSITTKAPSTKKPTTQGHTTQPSSSFSCEDRPDGYYANPSDCSKYYRCVVGNKYAFKCPAGLKFNDKIDVCDWPENVKCPKRNKVLFKGRKRRKGRKAV